MLQFNMKTTKTITWKLIFEKYKGKWVALKEDEQSVIASGENAKEVHTQALKKGFDMPIMLKIPLESLPYIGKIICDTTTKILG